jgi:copper chaperone CopZ
MQTIVSIPGIHCAGCASLIKDVSGDFPAIKEVAVDLDTKKVVIDHDDGFSLPQWTAEIEALNETYKVTPVA